jgi:phosphoglycerol transferase MdoB-like AlkP superfamily enzyme
MAILTFLFGAQLIYYKIFSTFGSLYYFIGTGKATQFSDVLFSTIKENILPFILILLPFILMIAFFRAIPEILTAGKKARVRAAMAAVVVQAAAVAFVMSSDEGVLSNRYLYSESFMIDLSVDRFGLLTTHRLDIKNMLVSINTYSHLNENESEDVVYAVESDDENLHGSNETVKEATYNVMNIDFKSLMNGEQKEVIKEMHSHFDKVKPTKQNKYTGMFKGKNLILITAEGFSPYAIDEKLTPTLYRMYNEGFKFTDFYTPLWGVSTTDGEYVACTSLIPKTGVWSFFESSDNSMPFCLGNQLAPLGYTTKAYHNHYFDYYFRDKSHPNMGYTYKGLGNGLNVTETWPESDVEMIELTVPEYIKNQPFHTYYMTVSGHLQYSFSGNCMSYKNKDLVKDLKFSERVKAYLACNIELDRAMESLIKQLDEAGIADDTLIAISPDHYPYGLQNSEINELAGHAVEKNFELYKGVFLLWSKGIEPVTISKPCSSLDIIPTLSNLMGLKYDSRLLMGKDIMSDSEPLVMFEDRSWITDKGSFNAQTGEYFPSSGHQYDEEYVRAVTETVKEKFKYSALILDYDYYSKFFRK